MRNFEQKIRDIFGDMLAGMSEVTITSDGDRDTFKLVVYLSYETTLEVACHSRFDPQVNSSRDEYETMFIRELCKAIFRRFAAGIPKEKLSIEEKFPAIFKMLTVMESKILNKLYENEGKTVNWHDFKIFFAECNRSCQANNVSVHIKAIRRKLLITPQPFTISTHHGKGWSLNLNQ